MHLNSLLLFKKYTIPYFKDHYKVLEIGPSSCPSVYQKVVNKETLIWHTIDFVDTRYIGNAVNNLTYTLNSNYSFPIDNDTYDIVLSGQVIEHVADIYTWLNEIKRITKKSGFIITINPVSWPYHEAPIDCWRIYPDGIKVIANKIDLSIQLALFESLEINYIKKLDCKASFIPGKSFDYNVPLKDIKKKIRWNKFIRKFPYLGRLLQIPIEVAFDTISILMKS